MEVNQNASATVSYEPNRFGLWKDYPECKEPSIKSFEEIQLFNETQKDTDLYTQPGKLFRRMNLEQL